MGAVRAESRGIGMKLGFLTLRKKLIAAFLFCLLVPTSIIGVFSYLAAGDQIRSELLNSAQAGTNAADMAVTQTLSVKMKDIEYYATVFSPDMTMEPEDSGILNVLDTYLNTHGDVLNMYLATPDGRIAPGRPLTSSNYDPRERPWYKLAMSNPGQTVMTPVELNSQQVPVVFISRTLPDGSGVVGLSLDLSALQAMTNMKIGQEGYVLILDNTHKVVVHPTLASADQPEGAWVDQLFGASEGLFSYTDADSSREMSFTTNELSGWKIAGSLDTAEIQAAVRPLLNFIVIVMVVSALLVGVAAVIIVRSLLRPLHRLGRSAESISQGDLASQVRIDSRDEVGVLASHFQTMVDNLRGMVGGIQDMTVNLSSSAQQLAAGAQQTTSAIEHVTVAMQDVASGTEQQAMRVQEGQDSMQVIAGKSHAMTELIIQMSELSEQAIVASDQGSEHIGTSIMHIDGIQAIVEELDSVINTLNERSGHIGSIITLISEIAKQTNLLALNASIEAARAGEQGKGFAVVATEVGKLAANSSASAQQIRDQISSIQESVNQAHQSMDTVKARVQEGIASIDLSGRSFSRIRRNVAKTAEQLDTITRSSEEVTAGANRAAEAMADISRLAQEAAANTETVSAAAQQQLASMEEIGSSAADLTHLAEQLRTQVEKFRIDSNE